MILRIARAVLIITAAAVLFSLPWLPRVDPSIVIYLNQATTWALIAVSLVILTGWVGQISLAHGTFVGIGAFATGLLVRNWNVQFPFNLFLVTLLSAAVASVLGVVALRVRGLYLAVATLIFAWMSDAYLFTKPWFVGQGGSSSIEAGPLGREDTVTAFDLIDERVVYVILLAVLAATIYAMSNLRESKTGRAFFAVRGSEIAAVSLGIDVTRYKLMAFSISGALAGLAGNLFMINLRSAAPNSFDFTDSLFFLSIAVVGGIGSLGGAVAAALLFGSLEAILFFYELPEATLEFLAVALLLVVLLTFPGGLGALAPFLRRAVQRVFPRAERSFVGHAEAKFQEPEVKAAARTTITERPLPAGWLPFRAREPLVRRTIELETLPVFHEAARGKFDWHRFGDASFALPPDRADRTQVLAARGITVIFGGLTAVNDMTLEVREHEIVGLIGPNGAGKTTFFNAVAGLNSPATGRVELFGRDVTALPVHVRAQLGVGRTFQLIQLFPQLTVFENLLVATHAHNETGVFRHLALTDRAAAAEIGVRREARRIVSLLDLEEVSERPIGGLPFGVLRRVEIARALVTRAPFLMLDEPASGLDNKETAELAGMLRFIRAELGVSILLIEHDVQMVTSVSDYMYVIEQGTPLAEGTPGDVRSNPAVIAAYLGEPAVA